MESPSTIFTTDSLLAIAGLALVFVAIRLIRGPLPPKPPEPEPEEESEETPAAEK